jgi:hypothetical protein
LRRNTGEHFAISKKIGRFSGIDNLLLLSYPICGGIPDEAIAHIIVDNHGTHKTAIIRKCFAKRPRFHIHFTPTYGSWINLVERWFGEITNKRIRRGVFRSVKELETAIREYIAVHDENPKPFRLDENGQPNPGQHRSFRAAHLFLPVL